MKNVTFELLRCSYSHIWWIYRQSPAIEDRPTLINEKGMAILKQIITTKTDQYLSDQNYKARRIGNFLRVDAIIDLADGGQKDALLRRAKKKEKKTIIPEQGFF